jgi:hypothetical protein
MKRRKFIALIGGAVAMPVALWAQQNERIRRLGVLLPFAKDGPESVRVEAFLQELQRLGWTEGRNLQIEYRWETSDLQKAAMELVALSPDVILVSTTPALSSMHQATRTVPIVFTQVADPVSAGFVTTQVRRSSAWPASLCFFDHSDAGHDLARRTITALESVVLDERQLERVKHAILLQSFDRCDLLTFLHRRQSHAGQNAPVIDMHGTRATLSAIARLFRTG